MISGFVPRWRHNHGFWPKGLATGHRCEIESPFPSRLRWYHSWRIEFRSYDFAAPRALSPVQRTVQLQQRDRSTFGVRKTVIWMEAVKLKGIIECDVVVEGQDGGS